MQPVLKSSRGETSSPTSIPLPGSPQSSRGEFDALIQLLAGDESPSNSVEPNVRARAGQTELRDADGRLDFSKIKDMFASSNSSGTRPRQDNKANVSQIGPVEENYMPNIDVASPVPNSPLRTSAIPTLNLSPLSRTRTNSPLVDSGPPPAESTPIPATRARVFADGNRNLASLLGPPWDSQLETNDSVSSLLSLKEALDLAQREVMGLRQRCRELENLHARSDTSLSADNLEIVGFDLPTSTLKSQNFEVEPSATDITPPPSSDEIHRALEMVAFVDELVWKRSRFGAPTDDPYGKENIHALQERLELWERTVRTRRRKEGS